jgi:N,N'-diacetyllegionaminate synthase
MNTIRIDGAEIGPSNPAFIIAEVANAHDGSLGFAHSFIDAAASTGVNAIKFQTHIADAESTLDEPFRVKFSFQDDTRYGYWKRLEFTAEQWAGLAAHAKEKGLTFLSSAFSPAAVDLLNRIGVPAWKVGSGEFRSTKLLDAMIRTGKPLLYSTGMSSWAEIDEAAAHFRARGAAFGIFQCTSKYPTALPEVGLNVLGEMERRYHCPVGLSDHSGSVWPGIAAMARGVHMLEAHITFDRMMFGPDVPASLTVQEFRTLTEARNAFAVIDHNPVDKDRMAADLERMRSLFTKSLAPMRALAAGTVLSADMLTAKKPGTGIPASQLGAVIGRRLARAVVPEHVLTIEDLDA